MKRVVPDTGVRGTGRITEDDTPPPVGRRVASVEAWRESFPEPTRAELADYLVGRKDLAQVLRLVEARRRSRRPERATCPGCGREVPLTVQGALKMHRTNPTRSPWCAWSRHLPNGPAPESELDLVAPPAPSAVDQAL